MFKKYQNENEWKSHIKTLNRVPGGRKPSGESQVTTGDAIAQASKPTSITCKTVDSQELLCKSRLVLKKKKKVSCFE